MNIITYTTEDITPPLKPKTWIVYVRGTPPTAWGKNRKQIHRIEPKGGRSFTKLNKPPSIKASEAWLFDAIENRLPDELFKGPLKLRVTVCWPYRKSERKSITKDGSLIPKDTSPDADNILSSVQDVLNGCVYKDDGQIYCTTCDKWWGPEGFVRIEVSELAKEARV